MRHEWKALCVGKRRPDWQLNHPEPSSAQTGSPTPATTRAKPERVSDHSQRSGAPHQAKRRPKPGAPRWALSWGIRRAPKGGLATWQPKCSDRATRCETPLLERHCWLVHSAHAAGWCTAPSGRRPEESGAVTPWQAWPSLRLWQWNGVDRNRGGGASPHPDGPDNAPDFNDANHGPMPLLAPLVALGREGKKQAAFDAGVDYMDPMIRLTAPRSSTDRDDRSIVYLIATIPRGGT